MHCTGSTTFVILALLFTVDFIQGSPMPSSTSNNIKNHVKQLLSLIGIENEYGRFLNYLKIHPPRDNPRLRALYDEYFSSNSYVSDLIDAYAKYYTMEEINQLVQFYSSPLGEKVTQFNQVLNHQMEDMMLTKISDYIFTASEYGLMIALPQLH